MLVLLREEAGAWVVKVQNMHEQRKSVCKGPSASCPASGVSSEGFISKVHVRSRLSNSCLAIICLNFFVIVQRLQWRVLPERRRALPLHLEEKLWWNKFERLNEVLAQEELAGCEIWIVLVAVYYKGLTAEVFTGQKFNFKQGRRVAFLTVKIVWSIAIFADPDVNRRGWFVTEMLCRDMAHTSMIRVMDDVCPNCSSIDVSLLENAGSVRGCHFSLDVLRRGWWNFQQLVTCGFRANDNINYSNRNTLTYLPADCPSLVEAPPFSLCQQWSGSKKPCTHAPYPPVKFTLINLLLSTSAWECTSCARKFLVISSFSHVAKISYQWS